MSATAGTERKRILICDRFSQEALLTLGQQSFLQIEKSETPHIENLDLSAYHGLIIRSRTQITRGILSKAKKLQVIITCTSGFDHIDLDAAKEWGVTVMFTPEANVESASQLTWSLVLACATQLVKAHKAIKAGEWNRDELVGLELNRKVYGVVGLGRIGKRVAEIASAFGMNVIAYDPYCDASAFKDVDADRVAYEEVLKTADILSFHVPKTAETHHMLSQSHFEYINRGLILVNTSRGSVISEEALCEALEKNYVGAVGLDVFEKEPLPRSSRLQNYPNVVLSPHLGANTQEAFQKASEQAALRLIQFFIDGTATDTLPPKAAWYGASPFWEKRQ